MKNSTTVLLSQILDVPRLEEAIGEVERIATRLLRSGQVIQYLQVIINLSESCYHGTQSYDRCHFTDLVSKRSGPMGLDDGSYCDVYI
jgi:hypothetical protein